MEQRKVLIIVENLPVPFDTRVWQEATTLVENGYGVSVICPKGKGYDKDYEYLQGVHIYRHQLPREGNGAGDMPVSIIVPCAMNITWPRKYLRNGASM